MSNYSLDGWMVAWNPGEPDSVEVGPWPDRTGWSCRLDFTMGCCELARHDWPEDRKVMMMFVDFHTLVVGDGIDPQAAHREFFKIDEYRRRIAPDIDGMVDTLFEDFLPS
jgi:hypothetical protein